MRLLLLSDSVDGLRINAGEGFTERGEDDQCASNEGISEFMCFEFPLRKETQMSGRIAGFAKPLIVDCPKSLIAREDMLGPGRSSRRFRTEGR
jgi:hypothetical protein